MQAREAREARVRWCACVDVRALTCAHALERVSVFGQCVDRTFTGSYFCRVSCGVNIVMESTHS